MTIPRARSIYRFPPYFSARRRHKAPDRRVHGVEPAVLGADLGSVWLLAGATPGMQGVTPPLPEWIGQPKSTRRRCYHLIHH